MVSVALIEVTELSLQWQLHQFFKFNSCGENIIYHMSPKILAWVDYNILIFTWVTALTEIVSI